MRAVVIGHCDATGCMAMRPFQPVSIGPFVVSVGALTHILLVASLLIVNDLKNARACGKNGED